MERIQVISIAGSIIFIAFVIEIIRRKKVKEAYALLWLGAGCFFMVFSCWRGALDRLSNLLGIAYSPAMLFLIMMMSGILIMIQYSMVISKQSDEIRISAQEIALIKERLRRLEKKNGE